MSSSITIASALSRVFTRRVKFRLPKQASKTYRMPAEYSPCCAFYRTLLGVMPFLISMMKMYS